MDDSIKKPNFFIIGAPKCGTTSLANYLRGHPDIFFSKPKELHYFSTDLAKDNRKIIYNSESEYLKAFKRAKGHKAVGEGSVWYLYSKEAVPNILKFNSSAKFIVMIRNPVEMFYSLYSNFLRSLIEDVKDPQKAWVLQKERKKGKNIPPFCYEPKLLQYGDICKLGKQVKNLFETVPNQNNIKVIKFNDFKNNTKKVYEETLDFLNLESDGREEFAAHNKNRVVRFDFGKVIQIFLQKKLGSFSKKLKKIIGIKKMVFI